MNRLVRTTGMAGIVACSAAGTWAATTSVDMLDLTSDQVIDVAAGDRYVICTLTGTDAHTLTKTGAGVLQIDYCDNSNATIVVSGGTLDALAPEPPAVAANAFFHVDASRSATITSAETSGTNLVSRWDDIRGDGHPYATNAGKNKPYLTRNYQNGRTVMDFGSFWGGNDDTATTWGAAMSWSTLTTGMKELFTVAMDTEDLKFKTPHWSKSVNAKRAGVWVGRSSHADNAGFIYRNARTAVEVGQDPSGAQNAPILNSGCPWASSAVVAIDGVTSGYTCNTPYPDGMHVLSLANTTTKAAHANNFASERGNSYGGIRMGETLVFETSLSVSERAEIENYLLRKWFTGRFTVAELRVGASAVLQMAQGGTVKAGLYVNEGLEFGAVSVEAERTSDLDLVLTADADVTVAEGETRTIRNLTGGAYTLTKKGLGTLVIEYCDSDVIGLKVEAGVLEVRRTNAPAVLGSAAFHVDASCPETYTTVLAGVGICVSRWNDVRGDGYPYASEVANNNCPFLNEHYANGRTVMDFGTLNNGTFTDGWGGVLNFSTTLNPVEIFMVAGDNEFAKGCVGGNGGNVIAARRYNTLFGNKTGTNPNIRGNGALGETSEIINPDAAFAKCGATCSLDGTMVNPKTTRLPDGLHVIGYWFTDADYLADPPAKSLIIDSFARERDFEKGGIRIAEYVIFTNALTVADRSLVLRYLNDRWEVPFRVAHLEVSAGATLSLPDAVCVRTVDYTCSGTETGTGYVKCSVHRLGSVNLRADAWIDVPEGEIHYLDNIGGSYGYSVVKTGAGRLVVLACDNAKARLVVKEGDVVVGDASGEDAVATFAAIDLADGTALDVAGNMDCRTGLLKNAGGTVTGDLQSDATADADEIVVLRGDVALDPLAAAPAFFHVDASATNTISISSSAPTNVICWCDVRGRKAKDGSDRPSDAGNFAWYGDLGETGVHLPNWGGDGFTQNGLPVMDFGEIVYSGEATSKPHKYFNWNEGSWNIRDFILVVGDNEKVKELGAKVGSISARNQAFLGHGSPAGGSIGYGAAMARGNRTQGTASPYVLSGANLGNSVTFACDGVPVSNPRNEILPDGMHVVSGSIAESAVMTSNAFFSAFARERNDVRGGQRLGEALIFTTRLTAAEREEYTRLLLTKWFGSNAVVRTYANIAVPSGASFALPNQALVVTADLSLAGTLAATSVTVVPDVINIPTPPGAVVKGTLTLPATGTFSLGDDWKTAHGGKYRLLGADNLSFADAGSLAGWTVTLPEGSRCRFADLFLDSDGIYVTLRNGLTVIFR